MITHRINGESEAGTVEEATILDDDEVTTDPHTQALVGDSSVSKLVEALRCDFQNLSEPLCQEIIDWLRDYGVLSSDNRNHQGFTSVHWQAAFLKILEYIIRHPAMTDIYAVIYIWNQPLLDDLIDHKNPAEFAARINVSREAVNKAVLRAQKYFNQAPRPGQRSKLARQHMTEARLRGLNRNHKP